jgi:hypothetical protein
MRGGEESDYAGVFEPQALGVPKKERKNNAEESLGRSEEEGRGQRLGKRTSVGGTR